MSIPDKHHVAERFPVLTLGDVLRTEQPLRALAQLMLCDASAFKNGLAVWAGWHDEALPADEAAPPHMVWIVRAGADNYAGGPLGGPLRGWRRKSPRELVITHDGQLQMATRTADRRLHLGRQALAPETIESSLLTPASRRQQPDIPTMYHAWQYDLHEARAAYTGPRPHYWRPLRPFNAP